MYQKNRYFRLFMLQNVIKNAHPHTIVRRRAFDGRRFTDRISADECKFPLLHPPLRAALQRRFCATGFQSPPTVVAIARVIPGAPCNDVGIVK